MKRRYEQKARLMNKNKSRKHHRLLRRERFRMQKAQLEELLKTDPEAALEGLQELERGRIEERLSLRHKTSKWAHLQGLRATTDKSVMATLIENQRMHKDLISKAVKPARVRRSTYPMVEYTMTREKERLQCEDQAMKPATLGSSICLCPQHPRTTPIRMSPPV
ncbi:U3 small nucleolar RNA-associated protein 14 A [Chionoecetes opilio]|uniref:U3 small nucleolar RNA-associated protein 14 A n=1 Tax=Chionoecetes opilio TaxID=41210 RepID=A0A8J8WBV7_CHIOP|nr:U3 small nucleolar RNA-associated protein 14 A [Chionoecetes opilio]